jgi:hypothetical protein
VPAVACTIVETLTGRQLRIGNQVMRHFGAVPWRFDAKAYQAAVARATPRFALTSPDVYAPQDEALTTAMPTPRLGDCRESLADELLQDLAP